MAGVEAVTDLLPGLVINVGVAAVAMVAGEASTAAVTSAHSVNMRAMVGLRTVRRTLAG